MRCASASLICAVALSAAGFAATPDGTVEIFVTSSADPYGLTRAEKAFDPTGNTVDGVEYYGYDLTDLGAGVPYALQNTGTLLPTPTAPVQIDPTRGEFAYVWVKMNAVDINARFVECQIGWDTPAALTDIAYYAVVDDGSGATVGSSRWFIASGEASPLQENPSHLVAGGTVGVQLNGGQPYASMLQQFYGNEVDLEGLPIVDHADGLWLLGAVAFDPNFRGTVAPELVSRLWFAGMNELDPPVSTTLVGAQVVPEPSALLLVLSLGALRRRR